MGRGFWRLPLLQKLAALTVVLAVALTARVVGTSAMRLPDGGVRPVSSDSHYYLRRIVATYQDFPHVPTQDSGLSCPNVAVPPWPGGVERITAGLAHVLLPANAPTRDIERFAAWMPVVAGVLTALAAWALATAWLGTLAGLLAGLLLGLLPLQIWYTAFGFLDHHMLLGLWLTALIWAVDRLLHRPQRREILVLAVILGVPHGLMTEAWIVALVTVSAALLTGTRALPAGPERRKVLIALVLAVNAAALVALPFILQSPYYLYNLVGADAPSRFSLWFLGGLGAALFAGLAAIGPQADRRFTALAVAAGVGAASVAVAAALDLGMRAALAAVAGFSGRAGIVATIEESKPFWRHPMPRPLLVFGAAILLLPVLPLGLAKLPQLRRTWLIALYICTAALALLQTRFGLIFAVPYVLAWAGVLTLQAPRFAKSLAVLATLGALTLLAPLLMTEHWSQHEESVWRTLVWMRDRLPPPSQTGQRCFLGPWDVGHKVLHVTGQPVIASNFTELGLRDALRDTTRVLLAKDFKQIEPLMQERQVRWVWSMATPWPVVQANAEEIGLPPPNLADALQFLGTRLLLNAGTAQLHGDKAVLGTGTLRRIHVSPLELQSIWQGQVKGPLREIALFERVKGARIVGHAQPGARVTATLEAKHPGATAFTSQQVAIVAADGTFSLQVPYATEGMPYGLVAKTPWRVQVGEKMQEIQVPEAAVQTGAEVSLR